MTLDPQTNNFVVEQDPAKSERQSSSWDIKNAPRNYVSLVFSQFGGAFFSFASVLLITRLVGSVGYGGIVAVVAASQVAQILANWSGISIVRFGVDEFIETRKITRIFWVRMLILIVNIVVVLALSGFWFPPLASWLKLQPGTFGLVISHFLVTAFWLQVQGALQAVKLMRLLGVLQFVERMAIFGSLVLFAVIDGLNDNSAIYCYLVGPTFMLLVGVFSIRKYIFSPFSLDRTFVKKVLVYSVPLLPIYFVGYFSGAYLDAVFISSFLSIPDLGIYSVATQINGLAQQLPALAGTLLLPMFVTLEKERQTEKIDNFFVDVLPLLTLIWGIICMFGVILGHFLIPTVFGSEFIVATIPFSILLAGSAAALPTIIGYSALAHAMSATYISMLAAFSAAIVNVVLNVFLIPRLGLVGCAWATFAACLIGSVVYGILLRRLNRIRFSWQFLSLLPVFGGSITYSISGSLAWSMSICTTIALLVIYLQYDSIRSAIRILIRFGSPMFKLLR